jgi:hypothetical protein
LGIRAGSAEHCDPSSFCLFQRYIVDAATVPANYLQLFGRIQHPNRDRLNARQPSFASRQERQKLRFFG